MLFLHGSHAVGHVRLHATFGRMSSTGVLRIRLHFLGKWEADCEVSP